MRPHFTPCILDLPLDMLQNLFEIMVKQGWSLTAAEMGCTSRAFHRLFRESILPKIERPEWLIPFRRREKKSPISSLSAYRTVEERGVLKKHFITILTEWMLLVMVDFRQCRETFYLSVELLHDVLSTKSFDVDKVDLQTVGCVCMYIASKYEEVYHIALEDLMWVSDRSFISQDALQKERDLLSSVFGWDVSRLTVGAAANSLITCTTFDRISEKEKERLLQLVSLLVDVQYLFPNLSPVEHGRFVVASGIVRYACCAIGGEVETALHPFTRWDPVLSVVSGVQPDCQLEEATKAAGNNHSHFTKGTIPWRCDANDQRRMFRKYNISSEAEAISTIPFRDLFMG